MEGNGEISDTDSGIILHSGCDSPTTTTKDVTTHTRAMKLKHQSLQERLELCVLELKKLCIREAELTGQLPADYPLLQGEKPPKVHRRIGAAFQLDEQSIPRGAEDSELSSVDTELALQLKIYEAARKLCREDHLSKAVRRNRLQQCKREERRLKELQESAFHLRLQHGRSSPLPAFNVGIQDQGVSDNSSLSDSALLEEEATSQSSQPSLGLATPEQSHPSQTPSVSSLAPDESSILLPSVASQLSPPTPSQVTPGQKTPSQHAHPSLAPKLSLNSTFEDEVPPIQHSPWTESSLDQPYQKSKKSRSTSSNSSSPASTQVLPPLEACLGNSPLPLQFSHLRLSPSLSSSTPSTPEMRLHRNLSLRISNPESRSDAEKIRGRARNPRRRLTDYTAALPESQNPANSEDSNSEHSSTSYTSSACQEPPCDFPQNSPSPSKYPHSSPTGSHGPPAYASPVFYQNARHQSSPGFHRGRYPEDVGYGFEVDAARGYYDAHAAHPSVRHDYWYADAPVHPVVAARFLPADARLPRSPSMWEHPHHRYHGFPRQVVNEELKSWHQRSQFRGPRPRSLDRQGAVRVKNAPERAAALAQNRKYQEQILQRRILQRNGDDAPGRWAVEDKIVSQV